MSNIRIGFSTVNNSPISWLVRKITGSKCSHAFFVYYDEDLETDIVMEASDVGFRNIPLSRFMQANNVVAILAPKSPIDVGFKYVALTYLGTAFDYTGLLGNGPILLGRWLKRKWHNPWNSPKSVFCSESGVIALQKSNVAGANTLVAADTNPQDLLDFMMKAVL